MGPCPWSCHLPGCGQGTGWSPGLDIPSLWELCPHLTTVISLLSTTLLLPSRLLPSPALRGSCEQWGGGGQGSTGTAAAMPARFCLEVQFTFLALPRPCQSPEDRSKAASNVAAGDNHWPRGLGESGSSQKPQPSAARAAASPEPFGGRLSSCPSHLRPQWWCLSHQTPPEITEEVVAMGGVRGSISPCREEGMEDTTPTPPPAPSLPCT